MKDFSYYRDCKSPYLTYEQKKEYKEGLIAQINSEKLTAAERDRKLADVKRLVMAYETEYNKEWREEKEKLEGEFWADARAELKYDTWLNKDGVSALEYKAYEDGHSSGYSEIYYHLCELTEFAEKIKKGLKISNPGTVQYKRRFIPGDIAISKIDIEFTDGSKHQVGQEIEITARNAAYYNVMFEHYEVKKFAKEPEENRCVHTEH